MAQQPCTPVNRNYGIKWCEFYGPRYVAREAELTVTYGMGFSRVYDRAGFALLNSFDQVGAAGLSTTIQNACCIFGVSSAEDLPRITGIHNIAKTNINGVQFLFPPPPPTWPQIPAVKAQANLGGIDNTMKTPHAYTADFSIQRELPQRFSIQLAYVGRFGRGRLTQRDLTQPLDIFDPKTGIDYYKAASALSNLARQFALANNGGQPTNYCQAVITRRSKASPLPCGVQLRSTGSTGSSRSVPAQPTIPIPLALES